MLFAKVCEGFIRSFNVEFWERRFFGLFGFSSVSCVWEVLVLLVSLLRTRLGLLRCASCWTRPLGGRRWVHYLRNHWRERLAAHKTAYKYFCICLGFMIWKPFLLASAGQPSLHGFYACMVYWTQGGHRSTEFQSTIFCKMITVLTRYRPIVLELI